MTPRVKERPSTPPRRGPALGKRLLLALVTMLTVALVLEAGLRLRGRPRGEFAPLEILSGTGYRPHADRWIGGRIPYHIVTNSLGMRSPEVSAEKTPGTLRIGAVGDSATDGFFVDNEATYPWRLQELLVARGFRVEVLNAAAGGGSIDRELRILRARAALGFDVAIVTFVTNDIGEIRGRSRETLLGEREPDPGFGRWLVTRTAIGETGLDLFIRLRSRRSSRPAPAPAPSPSPPGADPRYQIPGGDDFEKNAAEFVRRFGAFDGIIAGSSWQKETESLVENYLFVLEAMSRYCDDHHTRLVMAYCPSYPEVVLPEAPMRMRDTLRERCDRLGIPFLDYTPALRLANASTVLHIAPLDYHLNPAGNEVLAETMASFLEDRGLLAGARPPG